MVTNNPLSARAGDWLRQSCCYNQCTAGGRDTDLSNVIPYGKTPVSRREDLRRSQRYSCPNSATKGEAATKCLRQLPDPGAAAGAQSTNARHIFGGHVPAVDARRRGKPPPFRGIAFGHAKRRRRDCSSLTQ